MLTKLTAAVVCCAMSGAALAQHDTKADPKGALKKVEAQVADKKGEPTAADMEKAMMEAGTPGEMHKWIARSAGSWNATIKILGEGQASESKGTMTTEMIFGGRFAHSMFKGDFMGMPFEGVATLGYNNTSGKFESTWADSFSTATMFMTGSVDKDRKVLTMTGDCIDPMSKKPCKMKQVSTVRGDNEMFEEFYKTVDGKETKEMEITYTRAGAAAEKGAMDKVKDEVKKAAEDLKKQVPTGK